MRILVIGGTRFIGHFVVEQLLEEGHEVALFHRGNRGQRQGVTHILGDRGELARYRVECCRFAPRVVLDMIPMNEADALAVVETFRGAAERVVGVGSQDVYRAYGRFLGVEPGPVEPTPLTEDSPLREKLFPYRGKLERFADYDKIPVEHVYLSQPDVAGTMLRLPVVYGPRDGQHRLFEYLKRMEDGRHTIILDEGFARWRWSRGYVENVARAIALAVTDERAAGRIYNVGETATAPMSTWVERVGVSYGWQGQVLAVAASLLPDTLRNTDRTEQDLVVDTSRIRHELDYREVVSPEEALRRTIDWELANPPKTISPKDFDYAAEDDVLARLGEP